MGLILARMADAVIDPVLTAPVPTFTEADAAELAEQFFGVDGAARSVPSERDQTFLIDGHRPAVLKVSNAAEDPLRLDMEALAAQRVALVDHDLPVALPWLVPGTTLASNDAAAYRATLRASDGVHYLRMYDRLPGRASVHGVTLSDDAVRDWGTMAARVGRALRGLWHPAAARVMLWDPQHALRFRTMLDVIGDPEARALVSRALDRFEATVTPAWPSSSLASTELPDPSRANATRPSSSTVTGLPS